MPQGRLKVKAGVAVPTASKKKKSTNKEGLGLRKGTRYIAPKKTKLKQAEKVKKGLEHAIKSNIEQELQERASKEGKPFKVLSKSNKQKQKKKRSKAKK